MSERLFILTAREQINESIKKLEKKPYIAALRFPLAVLVVFIHAYNSEWRGIECGSAPIVPYFMSRVLPTFAVPLFFAISGYLFFLNRRQFGVADYVGKLRRRVLTLFIPYLLWNVIAFALYALNDVAAGRAVDQPFTLNIFWGCKALGTASINFWGWPIAASLRPILGPLWFVRDLIVCVVFTPIIHILLRRTRIVGLLLMAVIYYGQLWPNFGGMSFMGPWFFSLGAWFSIAQSDPLRTTRRVLKPSIALLLPCWLALMLFSDNGHPIHLAIQAVYVIAAMITSIHVADFVARQRRPNKFLSSSSFFVYASHTIVLLPFTSQAVRFAQGCNGLMQTALYVLCATAAIVVCLTAFYVLRRWLPRLSAPLTGIYS